MSQPPPPSLPGSLADDRQAALTPEAVETVLADFRSWLQQAATTAVEPLPAAPAEPIDLHTLLGQLVVPALRPSPCGRGWCVSGRAAVPGPPEHRRPARAAATDRGPGAASPAVPRIGHHRLYNELATGGTRFAAAGVGAHPRCRAGV